MLEATCNKLADGLDSERATLDDVVLVRVDEPDYFRCWRSSSAPKKEARPLQNFISPTEAADLLLKLPHLTSFGRGHAGQLPHHRCQPA